ncbi:MAG: DNA-3-methyladenine glycosylase [Ignavibacteriaceae bacterium]|nr:DNA-3-methyladenine glycosylase [Ignavibacteriaceae bacterium]HPO55281.1 DNA-3-methyladenine glycosylase [Ignavibacteriaceae bacterium]
MNLYRISSPSFFNREVVSVARDLLGKFFIKEEKNFLLAGKIVEVEAYDSSDPASHSFNGQTPRNSVMFLRGGHLYVYFIYGVHYCCNVVTGKKGHGAAVLIRALEPVAGIQLLSTRRFNTKSPSPSRLINLLNGPAKICSAFSIDKAHNGLDLLAGNIYIASEKSHFPAVSPSPSPENPADELIVASKRIGITKSTRLLWRFYLKNNIYVSKNSIGK